MRLLMIGGTRFVGRHVVEAALAAGHEVTLFHRGVSGAELFPSVEHRFGDRDAPDGPTAPGGLAALADGRWDATIDTCGYVPRHVHALADVLGDRGGHYTFVSSVSAYDRPPAGYREDARLATPPAPDVETVTGETYGGLKVACERAAVARFGTGSLIVRPTYVVGPHDVSWRFPWWVQRLARGGDVLAPGPADDPAQVIDARDMAAWMVALAEAARSGTFHAAAPGTTWADLLATVAAVVAPAGTRLRWVDADALRAEGLDGYQLPMWSGGDDDRFMLAADPTAAVEAGLRFRPLGDTIADTLAWAATAVPPATAPGLPAEREAELLVRLAAG